MIRSLVGSAFAFVARPKLLLLALAVALFNIFFLLFSTLSIMDVAYRTLVLGFWPRGELLQLPRVFLEMYPIETIIIMGLVLLIYASSAWLIFAYARALEDGKAGILRLAANAFRSSGQIILLTFFLALITALYIIITFALALISFVSETAGLFMLLLLPFWFLFGIYVAVKLFFLPAVMAVEKAKLKEALGRTWAWSSGRFFQLVLLICAIELAAFLLSIVGMLTTELHPDPLWAVAAYYPFAIIATAYSSMVLVQYYASHRKSGPSKS